MFEINYKKFNYCNFINKIHIIQITTIFCHISKFSWQRLKNRCVYKLLSICSRQYLYKFPRYTEQYICFYVEALLLPVLYILLGYFDIRIYSYLLVLYLQHCLVNPRWWIIYACHFCSNLSNECNMGPWKMCKTIRFHANHC